MSLQQLLWLLCFLILCFLGYEANVTIGHVSVDREISRRISSLLQKERESSLPYFVQRRIFGTVPPQPQSVGVLARLGQCVRSPLACRRELGQKRALALELQQMESDREKVATFVDAFRAIAVGALFIAMALRKFRGILSQVFDVEHGHLAASRRRDGPEVAAASCDYVSGSTRQGAADAAAVSAALDDDESAEPEASIASLPVDMEECEASDASEDSSWTLYRSVRDAFDEEESDSEVEVLLPLWTGSEDVSEADESDSVQDLVDLLQQSWRSAEGPSQEALNPFRKTPRAIHSPKDLWSPNPARTSQVPCPSRL